jgi:hypothetical protein
MSLILASLTSLATYLAFIAAGHWLASRTEHRADRLSAIQRDLWGTDKL